MLLGLATRDAIAGAPVGRADILAQWMSFLPGHYSPTLYRDTPARPLIYLESHMGPDGYRCLLAGHHDHQLRAVKAQLPADSIIRFDHEMTGPPTSWRTWGGMDTPLFVEGFRHVASILGPLHWCPATGPLHYGWYPAYYPGDEYVSHAGFTYYDRGKNTPLPEAWKRPIEAIRELTAKPILVGELGSLRIPAERGRVKWLRSLGDVEDVWGATYFDVDMRAVTGKSTDPDWTLNDAMRTVFEGMVN